jgi:hypothetical protein
VLLEIEFFRVSKFESAVPLYQKTDDLGLQGFLRDKFKLLPENGI